MDEGRNNDAISQTSEGSSSGPVLYRVQASLSTTKHRPSNGKGKLMDALMADGI